MASAPPSGARSASMGWIGPAISGAATLGGAAMGGKAAKEQAKIQERTTDKALAFTREQEAQRKAVYDQRMAQYTAMRDTLARRYGIDIGMPPTAAPGAAPAVPGAVSRGATPQSAGMPANAPMVSAPSRGQTLRDMMQSGGQPGYPTA